MAAFATAAFCACLAWGIGGELFVLYVDDIGTVLAALAATVLCLRVRKPAGGPAR